MYTVVVASFSEIKQNPVFRMLVLCIENYSQTYMRDNLQMEVAFTRYYKVCKNDFRSI